MEMTVTKQTRKQARKVMIDGQPFKIVAERDADIDGWDAWVYAKNPHTGEQAIYLAIPDLLGIAAYTTAQQALAVGEAYAHYLRAAVM